MTLRSAPRPAIRVMVLALVTVLAAVACTGPMPAPSASAPASASASGPPTATQTATSASTASQTPASSSTAIVDACALINPSEVSAIVGGPEPVAEPLPAGGWATAQCAWSSPTSSFLVRLGTSDSIKAFNDPATPDAEAMFADFKQEVTRSGSTRDVPGIGDGAVLGATGLAAYSGGTYLEIMRLRLSDEELTELAKQMMGNL